MNTKIIVGTAVLAASLWGSSDLMAQSKTSYQQSSFTSPARSTYQPLPVKRDSSSDWKAPSQPSYRSPSYTSPARSTYQPLPIKREPMYPTTRNERISLGNENAWRTQQNWRNH